MQLRSLVFSSLCLMIASVEGADKIKPFTFGNTLVTKFSGTVLAVDKKALDPTNHFVNETFINPQGAAVRLTNIASPKSVWRGQVLEHNDKETWNVPALAVGQVFSATYDDLGNAYVAATSSYGLNLTTPDICELEKLDEQGKSLCLKIDITDKDKLPERTMKGQPTARWMVGQFGKTGSPGSVWKINGRTGSIRLFTDIKLNEISNSGAALGDISYDKAHNQFFVSDMDTGMIHRVSNSPKQQGVQLDVFDHGGSARSIYKLAAIEHDESDRIDLTSDRFDTLNPKTWGFTKLGRQVWALQVHQDRLYYSVWSGKEKGSEIWSVAIGVEGKFSTDIRREIKVGKYQRHFKITDITFNKQGAMIIAQRGDIAPSYDYQIALQGSNPRVLRYWLELPNDPETESLWIAQGEEYAVGMQGEHRSTSGGIALGYGYTEQGLIDTQSCKDTLWTTGHGLLSENSISVSGLQGSPARPVRGFNTPPTTSYFINEFAEIKKEAINGWLGDVAIYTQACECKTVCSVSPRLIKKSVVSNPPVSSNTPKEPSLDTNNELPTESTEMEFPEEVEFPKFPDWCPYGLCGAVVACISPLDFWPWCENEEVVEPEKVACMKVAMSPAGPFLNGSTWSLPIGVTAVAPNVVDTVRILSSTPALTITSGVTYSTNSVIPTFTTSTAQSGTFDLCGYNSADAQTGKPYDCCRVKVKFNIRESQSDSDHQQLEIVQ